MSILIPVVLFPANILELFNLYIIVDKFYCFLQKKRIPCLLSTIDKCITGILNEDINRINKIKIISNLFEDKNVMIFINSIASNSNNDCELSFNIFPNPSIAHSNNRKKNLHKGISDYIKLHYISIINKESIIVLDKDHNKIFKNIISLNKWPNTYDVNLITLPTTKVVSIYNIKFV